MINNIPPEKRTYEAPKTPSLKTHEIHKDRDADGRMPWTVSESKVDENEDDVIVELNTNCNNNDLDLYNVYNKQGKHLRKYI